MGAVASEAAMEKGKAKQSWHCPLSKWKHLQLVQGSSCTSGKCFHEQCSVHAAACVPANISAVIYTAVKLLDAKCKGDC